MTQKYGLVTNKLDANSLEVFRYTYDPDRRLTNRKTAHSGGDTNGWNLRQTTYEVNSLNQYTNISTPGYKDIIGVALATNSVIVNSTVADRKFEYFHREISVANSSGPLWQIGNWQNGSHRGQLLIINNWQPSRFDSIQVASVPSTVNTLAPFDEPRTSAGPLPLIGPQFPIFLPPSFLTAISSRSSSERRRKCF